MTTDTDETQEPKDTPQVPASKSVLASKTNWINALSVLLPLLGVHFGWINHDTLIALATLLDCAIEDLPKVYVSLLAGVNIALRQVTTTPVHITKPKQ